MSTCPTPAPTAGPMHDRPALSAPPPPADTPDHPAHDLWRLMHAMPGIRRRFQFFVWTQSHLQPLLPHTVMACGAYHRQRRELVFDVFHSVVLSEPLLQSLSEPASPLLRAISRRWIEADGQPLNLPLNPPLEADGIELPDDARRELHALGHDSLLVHGVTRPQRPTEIETLFLFGGWPASRRRGATAHDTAAEMAQRLDLLLPQLHRAWQRVLATEQDLLRSQGRPPARVPRPSAPENPRDDGPITPRERQILRWVRDGLSNQAIALTLDISPLTVKNHVQKILRKLGAANRTQAVAQALAQGLIPNGETERPDDGHGLR